MLRVFLLAIVSSTLLAWGNPSPPKSGLRVLEGTFRGIKSNFLLMEADPLVRYRIPMEKNVKLISEGSPFSFAWLLPGDGIRVLLNSSGAAKEIEVFVSFSFGTVAFTSADRLTLLEGPQFFISGAPIYLNGKPVADVTQLKPPNEVLVRFDTLQKKPVGIWAFSPADGFDETPGRLANRSWVTRALVKNKLQINVKTIPSGRLSAQLLGAAQNIALVESQPGHYQATLPIPKHINLPKSYLSFAWAGSLNGEKIHETWIFPKSIMFYMEAPMVKDFGPSDGTTVPVNPPFIFANFNPRRSPLDLNSVRLLVDRRNVTDECYVAPHLIFFSPNKLAPGKHECFLSGRAVGGNGAFHLKWSFHVQ